MEQLFDFKLSKILNSSKKEALEREKNLKLFLKAGLPNKQSENWKFTDLNSIINKNFKNITNNQDFKLEKKIDLIDEFEHNNIVIVNGSLKSVDMKFEDKEKLKIEKFNSTDNFAYNFNNNLSFLNKALSLGGFFLEIDKNYKCKKPIVVYNYFSANLDNKIINNSNKIKVNQNSELTLIEYNVSEKSKFLKNTFENIHVEKDATLRNFTIQKTKSNGFL